MSEQYKTTARNFIEKGLNQKDMTALDEYFSPRLTDHALPPGLPAGRDGRKMFASALLAAFPDLHVQLEDMVAEGEKVVTRYTVQGTHSSDLMGIPATGKQVSVGGIAIDRFEDGQSVEHWEIFDQMGLMQQLGVIPV
jgi:steroid delta-isomerase-like uncharacterized protein